MLTDLAIASFLAVHILQRDCVFILVGRYCYAERGRLYQKRDRTQNFTVPEKPYSVGLGRGRGLHQLLFILKRR
jgi:hypothetical protein